MHDAVMNSIPKPLLQYSTHLCFVFRHKKHPLKNKASLPRKQDLFTLQTRLLREAKKPCFEITHFMPDTTIIIAYEKQKQKKPALMAFTKLFAQTKPQECETQTKQCRNEKTNIKYFQKSFKESLTNQLI